MSIAITEDHRLARRDGEQLRRDVAICAAPPGTPLESAGETLPAFWSEFAELGWLGLHLPEDVGGSGYGIDELVIVVEELGRSVAPGPFVPTVIASAVLAATADDEVALASAPRVRRRLDRRCGRARRRGDGGGGVASGDAGVVLGAGLASVHPRSGRRRRRRHRGRRRRHGRHADPTSTRADAAPASPSTGAAATVIPGARRTLIDLARVDPVGRRGRCGSRVHLDGRRVLQGTDPVRPTDRDVPGGEAPLRQHGRRHRTRHERHVGRRPCRSDGRRPAHLCGCSRGDAGRSSRRSVRQPEHPGARRHRDHVGARRPSLHASSDHVAPLPRRCRSRSRADRPDPTGRRA